jgi:hypothetical protein
MVTRKKSYSDYGFADRAEAKELILHCRKLDREELELLKEAAERANPGLADVLVESLVHGQSYAKLIRTERIPICEKDFYAYRRKALGVFREFIEEKRGKNIETYGL